MTRKATRTKDPLSSEYASSIGLHPTATGEIIWAAAAEAARVRAQEYNTLKVCSIR
jgi:hypothetical protein